MQGRPAVLVATLVLLTLSSEAHAAGSGGGLWTSAGQDLGNTRHQTSESRITPTTVGSLQPKWIFTTAGDVSATPAVDGSKVYFPDWTGNLYAVDRRTGQEVWRASIPAASGIPGDKARATPVVSGDKVIVGTQGPFGGGGRMLAFDKTTGAILWTFVSGGSCLSGAAISGGDVYWGSGYSNFGFGTPNNKVYAFTVP